jgi:hypothetical protein
MHNAYMAPLFIFLYMTKTYIFSCNIIVCLLINGKSKTVYTKLSSSSFLSLRDCVTRFSQVFHQHPRGL